MVKNIIEQAAWVGYEQARIIPSFTNYFKVSVGTLLDGAYLGLPGEPILIPSYSHNLRIIKLGLYGVEKGMDISASNPGINIMVSRFLSSKISGDVLAILDGTSLRPITHVEAVNKGLLEERDYPSIFTYNGDGDSSELFQRMQELEDEFGWIHHALGQDISVSSEESHIYSRAPELPSSAFQVTKKGHGSIFLENRIKQQSPAIQPRMQYKF